MVVKDVVYQRNECRLCGQRNLELVFPYKSSTLPDAYVSKEQLAIEQERYPLDLYLCNDCGFTQLLTIIEPKDIYVNYIYETKSSSGLIDHFEKNVVDVLAKVNPSKGSLVVDIGSNDGTLLEFYQKAGMKTLGIDPAVEIAKRATERGIETLSKLFNLELAEQIKDKYGVATIVSVNNLFANVDKLTDLTKGIRHLLAPEGVFVFESFYILDLVQNKVFDFIYHEHISCFSVKPLKRFFNRLGMELIDVKHIPTKGGSLRYTVQLAGGPHKEADVVQEYINRETDVGLHNAQFYRDFYEEIDDLKNELLNILKEFTAEGKTIAGYGASATTTTMLYHYGLKEYIEYIADDNPIRQGRYSPGMHIPIISSKEMCDKKIDYVLIFAWRYWEEIVNKNSEYLKQGGRFIVPLPEIKVISKSSYVLESGFKCSSMA